MEAAWSKRVTRSLATIGIFLAIVLAAAVVALVQSAGAAARGLPSDLEVARQLGFSPDPEELAWNPEERPDNAWSDYAALQSRFDAVIGESRRAGYRRLYGVLYGGTDPSRMQMDQAILEGIVQASQKPDCHFPISWAENTRASSMYLVGLTLYAAAGSVVEHEQGNLQRAEELALASCRVASHAGQGILRETTWSRLRSEQIAIRAATLVASRMDREGAARYLRSALMALGPLPPLTRLVSGEVARTFTRIGEARFFAIPEETMPETLWKTSLQGRALTFFVNQLSALENTPEAIMEDYAKLEKADELARELRLIMRYVPSDLRRVAYGAAISHTERMLLESLADLLAGVSADEVRQRRDPYGNLLLVAKEGFSVKSLGMDGEEAVEGIFAESRDSRDDLVLSIDLSL